MLYKQGMLYSFLSMSAVSLVVQNKYNMVFVWQKVTLIN